MKVSTFSHVRLYKVYLRLYKVYVRLYKVHVRLYVFLLHLLFPLQSTEASTYTRHKYSYCVFLSVHLSLSLSAPRPLSFYLFHFAANKPLFPSSIFLRSSSFSQFIATDLPHFANYWFIFLDGGRTIILIFSFSHFRQNIFFRFAFVKLLFTIDDVLWLSVSLSFYFFSEFIRKVLSAAREYVQVLSQCDQALQNFATLAKFYKSLAIFWKFIWYLAKLWAHFGNLL